MPIGARTPSKSVRPAGGEVELDVIDRQILRLLAADARTPNNALAEAVGVAPSTCLMRVRRLQETGVIRGFRAEIAPDALGRPLQALISVRLQAHARARIGSFTAQFAALPGVLNVFFLAGADDFQLHVAARSPDDLREFVVRYLSASKDVAGTQTSLIFEHVAPGTGLT